MECSKCSCLFFKCYIKYRLKKSINMMILLLKGDKKNIEMIFNNIL